MTRADWLFINTFADWFAAFGTVAAVALSIWLARARTRVRLRVRVDLRFILQPGLDASYQKIDEDYITFSIVNVGETEATVNTIGWFGRAAWKKMGAIQNLGITPIEQRRTLPAKLGFGEEALILIKLEPHWVADMRKMIGPVTAWSRYWLRAAVWTSNGQVFKGDLYR